MCVLNLYRPFKFQLLHSVPLFIINLFIYIVHILLSLICELYSLPSDMNGVSAP